MDLIRTLNGRSTEYGVLTKKDRVRVLTIKPHNAIFNDGYI
jgi:hypothetical protein